MKKYITIIGFLLTMLIINGCSTEKEVEKGLQIYIGDKKIAYYPKFTDQADSESDGIEGKSLNTLALAEYGSKSNVPPIKFGESVKLDFASLQVEDVRVYDRILNGLGEVQYGEELTSRVDLSQSGNVYSFTLQPNIAASLSSVWYGDFGVLRGFQVLYKIDGKQQVVVFLIRTNVI